MCYTFHKMNAINYKFKQYLPLNNYSCLKFYPYFKMLIRSFMQNHPLSPKSASVLLFGNKNHFLYLRVWCSISCKQPYSGFSSMERNFAHASFPFFRISFISFPHLMSFTFLQSAFSSSLNTKLANNSSISVVWGIKFSFNGTNDKRIRWQGSPKIK